MLGSLFNKGLQGSVEHRGTCSISEVSASTMSWVSYQGMLCVPSAVHDSVCFPPPLLQVGIDHEELEIRVPYVAGGLLPP